MNTITLYLENDNKEEVNFIKDFYFYISLKNKHRKYKMLTTNLKSFSTIVIIATTSISIALNPIGTGLIVMPISASIACGITISNKVKYELFLQKYQKNSMRKIDKLLNLSMNYTENLNEIMYLIKMNMNHYVIFLIGTLKKRKMSRF